MLAVVGPMRISRWTLLRSGQLLLLLPSAGLFALALNAGIAGVIGGTVGFLGVDDADAGLRWVYVLYILLCAALLVPALGYALLVLLIVKGPAWMAARHRLAVLTITVGALACVIATWMALGADLRAFDPLMQYPFILIVPLVVPVVLGVCNLGALVAALAGKWPISRSH